MLWEEILAVIKPVNVIFMEKRLKTLALIDEIRIRLEEGEYEF